MNGLKALWRQERGKASTLPRVSGRAVSGVPYTIQFQGCYETKFKLDSFVALQSCLVSLMFLSQT